MKHAFVRLLTVLVLFTGGLSFTMAAHETAVPDIIRMSQAGLSDETILTFVRANQIRIELTAEDLVALAEAGVSEDLINALMEYWGAPLAVPAYVAAPYPVSFYSSYYYDPWFYSPWFYHDFFFDFHFGGHLGLAHHGGVHHVGHGFVAGHGSGGHHGGIHGSAGHHSAVHTRRGASDIGRHTGVQHAS